MQNQFLLKIALHVSFFFVGIVTVLLGQILPVIAANLKLNDEQAGSFLTSQFIGSIIGTISSAFLIRHAGFLKTIGFGFLLFLIGLSGINLGGHSLAWMSAVTYGVGFGVLIPGTLLLTASLNPIRTTSALNLMSFAWGLGAIFCQPFVSFSGNGSFLIPTLILAGASLVFSILYLFGIKNMPADGSMPEEGAPAPKIKVWSDPKAWLITAFGFFDVGIESGVIGWLTSYTMRSDIPSEISWLSATPIFLLFFVIARGIVAILARFLSNNFILWGILLITLIGTIMLSLSSGWQMIFVSAAILGLGLGAVFPTNMARFTQTFGQAANEKTVPLFVMGSFGSITISWLIGYFSNLRNSLQDGLKVLLAAAALLLILQFLFVIMGKSKALKE